MSQHSQASGGGERLSSLGLFVPLESGVCMVWVANVSSSGVFRSQGMPAEGMPAPCSGLTQNRGSGGEEVGEQAGPPRTLWDTVRGHCRRGTWKQPASPRGQAEGPPMGKTDPQGPPLPGTGPLSLGLRGWRPGVYGGGFAGSAITGGAVGLGVGPPSGLSGPGPYVLTKEAWLLGAGGATLHPAPPAWPCRARNGASGRGHPCAVASSQGLMLASGTGSDQKPVA